MDICANSLEYDEENKFMTASGSITITWGNRVLRAESVKYWVDGEYMVAEGSVTLKENESVIFADRISYDIAASSGEIYNASGYFDEMRFKAKTAVRHNEKEYSLHKSVFTNCNLRNPHYTIHAKRAKILPNKRFVVYNPVFWVRRVPVFYFPIFWQGLGPHRDNWEIQPGYNSTDGFIAKIIYGYKLTDQAYAKLYFDYYSQRGLGKGAEYTYYIPDKIKGSIYGYHIKEQLSNLDTTTETERWTFYSFYWQRFSPLWIGQGELNFLSDTTLQNSYFQDNWWQSTQELTSNFSLTRQSSKSNLRFTTQRIDALDPVTGEFYLRQLTIPRVEYTLFPIKNKYFFNSNSLTLQNTYDKSYDYYALTGSADSNIYRSFRLSRSLTLSPRLGVTENWSERTSQTDLTDIFRTYYYSSLNLRYRPFYWADWDFTHSYRIRTQQNSFLPDIDAIDYGRETNSLAFQNSMYFNFFTLRNALSYDLRLNRGETLEDWKQKLSPLVNELIWTPLYFASLYLREESALYPKHSINSIQTELSLGTDEDYYFGLGTFYQSASLDQLAWNLRAGFWLTSKWKFNYLMQITSLEKLKAFQTMNEELTVYRDLHCWQALVRYRRRLNIDKTYINEVYLQFDMKTAGPKWKKQYQKVEREIYPWK